jgi:hypothetical protein
LLYPAELRGRARDYIIRPLRCFATGTYQVSERWWLRGGVRYDRFLSGLLAICECVNIPSGKIEKIVADLQIHAPILATILYRPPVTDHFVARTELESRLKTGLGLPLTVVSAPAGYAHNIYGKLAVNKRRDAVSKAIGLGILKAN